jgi:hypothetical protein
MESEKVVGFLPRAQPHGLARVLCPEGQGTSQKTGGDVAPRFRAGEILTDIIVRGDLESLKRIAKECEKTPIHFTITLSMNRTDAFIFLYENGWQMKGIDLLDIEEEAILYYNLEVMKYLYEKGHKFRKKEYSILAVGRIKCKDKLGINSCDIPPPKDQCGLEMIKFLREVSCPISKDAYISAVVSGNFECIKFLYEIGLPWHVSTLSCAIIGRKIDIFMYCATHNAPLTRYVRRFIKKFNHQSNILKMPFDSDCESIILSFLRIDTKNFNGSRIKKDKRFIKDLLKGDGDFVVPQPLRQELDMDGDYGISVEY